MSTGWRYVLCRSSDMQEIGVLRAHDKTISCDINKSGDVKTWISMDDTIADYISHWETCVLAQYNDAAFWSGPVTGFSDDYAAGRLSIRTAGWFERLMRLLILDQTLEFSNKDAGFIVSSLLDKAREQYPDLPITIGTVEPTQLRTITYQRDQNIGEAIQAMAELEAGYDWYIDPLTRKLNIVAKRCVVRPNLVWTFVHKDGQVTDASNLANAVIDSEGMTMTNDYIARSATGNVRSTDPFSAQRYGVFQTATPLNGVVDDTILAAYANEEIVFLSTPRQTYSLTPKPSTHPGYNALFRDFDIGDVGYLTAQRGRRAVTDQAVRLFGMTMSIQDNGVENITEMKTTAN